MDARACRCRDRLWLCVITSASAPANNHPRKPDQRPHLIASEAARWWECGAQSGGHLRQIGFITFLVTNNRRGPKVAIPNGISSTCVDAGNQKKKKRKEWGRRLTLLKTTTGSVFDEKLLFVFHFRAGGALSFMAFICRHQNKSGGSKQTCNNS